MKTIIIDEPEALEEVIRNNKGCFRVSCNFKSNDKIIFPKELFITDGNFFMRTIYDELGYQLEIKNSEGALKTLHHNGRIIYRRDDNFVFKGVQDNLYFTNKNYRYHYKAEQDSWFKGKLLGSVKKIDKHEAECDLSKVLNLIKNSYHSNELKRIEEDLKEEWKR